MIECYYNNFDVNFHSCINKFDKRFKSKLQSFLSLSKHRFTSNSSAFRTETYLDVLFFPIPCTHSNRLLSRNGLESSGSSKLALRVRKGAAAVRKYWISDQKEITLELKAPLCHSCLPGLFCLKRGKRETSTALAKGDRNIGKGT